VRLEGLGQLKNPMTSSGIKPTTFLRKKIELNSTGSDYDSLSGDVADYVNNRIAPKFV
jgi:hypothetical protein